MNKSAIAYCTLPGLKKLIGVEHKLKIWPEHFEAVTHPDPRRRKTVEIRKDDRGYCVGDTLHLQEWDPKNRDLQRMECEVSRYAYSPGRTVADGRICGNVNHAGTGRHSE
ncbi:DUF3850 domain-containing protein [Paenibacillus thiaminolyticus]|uniref:DUF3850 domain-containing protein n=1 Tax=Paenibacillus thiaminolyticus TaxID=49283 RepID=UPI00234FE0FA|nr:DUF3850 domain-containing protein [Paenibacillus thiaminolyticus]WCR29734.1 DUF3850 domain-containing protein [Paenibacillus thiaminolyticus]